MPRRVRWHFWPWHVPTLVRMLLETQNQVHTKKVITSEVKVKKVLNQTRLMQIQRTVIIVQLVIIRTPILISYIISHDSEVHLQHLVAKVLVRSHLNLTKMSPVRRNWGAVIKLKVTKERSAFHRVDLHPAQVQPRRHRWTIGHPLLQQSSITYLPPPLHPLITMYLRTMTSLKHQAPRPLIINWRAICSSHRVT